MCVACLCGCVCECVLGTAVGSGGVCGVTAVFAVLISQRSSFHSD